MLGANTKVATPFGLITIKELAEKKGEDRFLVYTYDFDNTDYSVGWAHSPKLVGKDDTVTVVLDNGDCFVTTFYHQVLLRNGKWAEAGRLKWGNELMPFYRKMPNSGLRHAQYPRIFTFRKGWIHERQFIDDWKNDITEPFLEEVNRISRMIGKGLTWDEMEILAKHSWQTLNSWIEKEGFSHREIKILYKNKDRRRVIGVHNSPEQDVYDLSVDDYSCFASESVIIENNPG